MAETKYGELAKKAKREVEELDEPYRSIAFKTILDELIRETKSLTVAYRSQNVPTGQASEGEDPVAAFMGRAVDASKYAKLFSARGYLVEKSMAVLKLARDEFGIDSLAPPDIAKILMRKFRVARVHATNISRDLGKKPEYVSRVGESKGRTMYMLMTPGEQRLDETIASLQ